MSQQWMTSKTKKRLSSSPWDNAILALTLIMFMAIVSYLLRLPTMNFAFNHVLIDIPSSMQNIVPKQGTQGSSEPLIEINKHTPVIVFGYDSFIFGSVDSFTEGFKSLNNKFKVSHINDEPQLGTLLRDLKKWDDSRLDSKSLNKEAGLVLVSASKIPIALVADVAQKIKQSSRYKYITLSQGMIGDSE